MNNVYTPREAVNTAFLDELIKRSPEAEDILRDCGRIRLHRAAIAVIELYLESGLSARRTRGAA